MALVITRRKNEGFWLEIDGIEPIHVVLEAEPQKNRSKVAITADPEQVRIYRDEIWVKVLEQRLKDKDNAGAG